MAYKKFSTTREAALSSAMTSGDTTVLLVDGSTYPDPAVGSNGPYTVLIGYGSDREEICTVTAKPTVNTLTVTRGEDGSTATAKNIGDVVVHGVSKRDWEDLLPKAGGTMTGALVLQADPAVELGAATKQYVDTKAPLANPTFTGNVVVPDADAANEAVNKAQLDAAIPLGVILPYAGTIAPAGWHLCDGTAHGSSALTTLLGSANTPDLRDRFIVGAGSSYSRGATGGEATHTLTAAEMPTHTHTYSSPLTTVGSDQGTQYNSGYNMGALPTTPISVNTSGSAGSGAAHENRPPYYALVYIVKKA